MGVRRFVDLHGDIDVTEISRVHVEQYRNALRQLPSRPPNQIREQSLTQQIEWGLLNNAKTIGQAAINKNLLGVKQTLEFAFWETAVFTVRTWTNPFDGFSKKPKKSNDPIRPFSSKQLEIIFSRNVYKTKTAEKFWIPLILFYTGARLDEISQLHVADVLVDPVPHFLAENLEDEDPTVAKKLKTESSHRTIPIHRTLIELGLLDYAEAVQKSGERHLFPGLTHTKDAGRGDAVSRDFIRRFRKFGESNVTSGLNTKSLVTHSLRHAFRTAALYLPDQTFVMIAMGHYVPGESIQTYGKQAYLMPDLLSTKVMEDIALPQLDQAFLKEEADRYLRQITSG